MDSKRCLLEQLESSGCLVDVDSFMPSVAKSLPFRAHDATSNQALIGLCVYDPDNLELVKNTIRENPEASSLDILTTLVSFYAGTGTDLSPDLSSMQSLVRSSWPISTGVYWPKLHRLSRTTNRRSWSMHEHTLKPSKLKAFQGEFLGSEWRESLS
jgi:hypothetical protein